MPALVSTRVSRESAHPIRGEINQNPTKGSPRPIWGVALGAFLRFVKPLNFWTVKVTILGRRRQRQTPAFTHKFALADTAGKPPEAAHQRSAGASAPAAPGCRARGARGARRAGPAVTSPGCRARRPWHPCGLWSRVRFPVCSAAAGSGLPARRDRPAAVRPACSASRPRPGPAPGWVR